MHIMAPLDAKMDEILRGDVQCTVDEFYHAMVARYAEIAHTPRPAQGMQSISHYFLNVDTNRYDLQASFPVLEGNLLKIRHETTVYASDLVLNHNISAMSRMKFIKAKIPLSLHYETLRAQGRFPGDAHTPVTIAAARAFYKKILDLYEFAFILRRKSEYEIAFGVLIGLGIEEELIPPDEILYRKANLLLYLQFFFLTNIGERTNRPKVPKLPHSTPTTTDRYTLWMPSSFFLFGPFTDIPLEPNVRYKMQEDVPDTALLEVDTPLRIVQL